MKIGWVFCADGPDPVEVLLHSLLHPEVLNLQIPQATQFHAVARCSARVTVPSHAALLCPVQPGPAPGAPCRAVPCSLQCHVLCIPALSLG